MAESSPLRAATPKRKRDDIINERRIFNTSPSASTLPRSIFTFQPPTLKPVERRRSDPIEDGSSSPRSKVAQQFQDLALGSGGGVTFQDKTDGTIFTELGNKTESSDEASAKRAIDSPRFSPELSVFDFEAGSTTSSLAGDEMQLDDDYNDNASRKRIMLPHHTDFTLVGSKEETNSSSESSSDQSSEPRRFMMQTDVDPTILRTMKSGGSGRLQKSYPSINRLSDSKSRSRRRAGTPPMSKRRAAELPGDDEPIITDPIRAALTWHEDEITVYDPEDKDDDGTGINGIGFKPTAAIAYARAQKRKQQLAEYRKREESEARAKRNQRRREQFGDAAQLERKHSIARVRFSEAGPSTVTT
ncbi:hypothetical protein F4821DRAFT_244803 [Hypoxylon rubiginosum]|uniref:Uncharacterized protein n=1 Tax=Hypoxylon rubiginosum TaxID=110542 RepID=A0ACC0CSK5_9PEZI|nr:hypothetical protein F4821DRAFT_244803 [Hypoxylon rubiginosum]